MAAHDIMPSPVWLIAAPLMIGVGSALMCIAAWIFNRGPFNGRMAAGAFAFWLGLSVFASVFGYGRLEIALGPGVSGALA